MFHMIPTDFPWFSHGFPMVVRQEAQGQTTCPAGRIRRALVFGLRGLRGFRGLRRGTLSTEKPPGETVINLSFGNMTDLVTKICHLVKKISHLVETISHLVGKICHLVGKICLSFG